MYTELSLKQVLRDESLPEFSAPISMEGANAVYYEVTLFYLEATSVSVLVEESDDLENWSSPNDSAKTFAGGYDAKRVTGIGSAYVRLRYDMTSSTGEVAVLGAGINTKRL